MAIPRTKTPTTSDSCAGDATWPRRTNPTLAKVIQVTCVCVCVRKEGKPGTRKARKDANYREGSSEIQANLLYEVRFRRWLMRKVTTEGGYDRTTAIAEGAELVGCSPLTTARYITKLTSPLGPLTEIDDALYHRVLVLKPHLHNPAEPPSPS